MNAATELDTAERFARDGDEIQESETSLPPGGESRRGLQQACWRRLEGKACLAVDSGFTEEVVNRICSAHLYGNYRALICFPDEGSVVIALVGEHSRGSSDDVYGAVYELLGIDEPIGKRTKPPCCDEAGGPPVDSELLDRMLRAAARLQRRRGLTGVRRRGARRSIPA